MLNQRSIPYIILLVLAEQMIWNRRVPIPGLTMVLDRPIPFVDNEESDPAAPTTNVPTALSLAGTNKEGLGRKRRRNH